MTDFSKAKGNNTLQSVASKSALMKAGAVVKQLPVQDLKDNPDNSYLFGMEPSDIEFTADGIRKNGFKGAINVYVCPDGTYEVYSGHLRKYAAIAAGLKTIPCLVEPEPSETVKRRQLLGANLYGRNKIQVDNPILVARQIHFHRETLEKEGFKGDTREQIASEFRIAESQVYKYESLLKLEPELQEIAASRKAPFSVLYTAKTLSREEQLSLVSMIIAQVEKDKEPVTQKILNSFLDSILCNQPMDGQFSIEDYEDVHDEHLEADMEEVEDEEVEADAEAGIQSEFESGTSFGAVATDSDASSESGITGMSGGSQKITVKPEDRGDAVYSASRGVRESDKELEALLIRLETKLSQTSEIHWSDPAALKRTMQSLVAMLEDEINDMEENDDDSI